MLFPSHHQAVRVQSSDAQTRLDRQLYTSTAANPSFEFCISQHEAAMQFSFQPAPTKPHGPHVGVSQAETEHTHLAGAQAPWRHWAPAWASVMHFPIKHQRRRD